MGSPGRKAQALGLARRILACTGVVKPLPPPQQQHANMSAVRPTDASQVSGYFRIGGAVELSELVRSTAPMGLCVAPYGALTILNFCTRRPQSVSAT
jgi:hypothetical protein